MGITTFELRLEGVCLGVAIVSEASHEITKGWEAVTLCVGR